MSFSLPAPAAPESDQGAMRSQAPLARLAYRRARAGSARGDDGDGDHDGRRQVVAVGGRTRHRWSGQQPHACAGHADQRPRPGGSPPRAPYRVRLGPGRAGPVFALEVRAVPERVPERHAAASLRGQQLAHGHHLVDGERDHDQHRGRGEQAQRAPRPDGDRLHHDEEPWHINRSACPAPAPNAPSPPIRVRVLLLLRLELHAALGTCAWLQPTHIGVHRAGVDGFLRFFRHRLSLVVTYGPACWIPGRGRTANSHGGHRSLLSAGVSARRRLARR